MPGIDINRFVNLNESYSGSLVCGICLNIFDNAVNSECRHSFCRECVQQSIDTNHKECPKCKKGFTPRKRPINKRNETDLILIGGYIFRSDFTANGIISDLKIKCSFDYNGCKEELKLDSLSSHLKDCEHSICKTCEFPAQPIDPHNCIELMRNQIKELKSKNQNMTQELRKERNQKIVLKMKLETKEKSLITLRDEIIKYQEHIQKFNENPKANDLIGFGTVNDCFTDFTETPEGIDIRNFKRLDPKSKQYHNLYSNYYITVPFIDIVEMIYSINPQIPYSFLTIKPNNIFHKKIQKFLTSGTYSKACPKSAKSQSKNGGYISIYLTKEYSERIPSLMAHCKVIQPKIKFKQIEAKASSFWDFPNFEKCKNGSDEDTDLEVVE